jgi:hypothetical protein
MAAPPDSSERRDDQAVSADQTASDEIARSLGAVWHRFSGRKPKAMSVEVQREMVRCVITENPAEHSADGAAEDSADGDIAPAPGPGVGSLRFGYDATAVVARATHQRVIAFIPKRDAKTQIVTQTYILDRPRMRF